jgi:hypothetical protein
VHVIVNGTELMRYRAHFILPFRHVGMTDEVTKRQDVAKVSLNSKTPEPRGMGTISVSGVVVILYMHAYYKLLHELNGTTTARYYTEACLLFYILRGQVFLA